MERRGHAGIGRRARRAPGALRRRVIAGVRSESAPARSGYAWAAALALAASGVLAVAIGQTSGSRTREQPGLVSSSVGGAHAALLRTGSAVELSLAGMPVPGAGQTYEIWLLDGHGELRALQDMFTVTSAGRAIVELPGDLRRVRELILTREPIGGSVAPAGPPLLEILNPSALVG